MRTRTVVILAIVTAPVVAAAQQLLPPPPGAGVDGDSRFEVASVRPVNDSGGQIFMRMTPASGLEATMPVGMLLRQALRKPDYQIVGAPDWVDTERYSIRARAPEGTPPAAVMVMLANLLRDRFQLATHLETRELPVFQLVLAYVPEPGRYAGPSAPPPGAPAPATDPNVASLAVALQEQLGLKFDGARGPVEVMVIERIERPTPD